MVEQRIGISQRTQFFRSDRSAAVQIGPDLIAINQLPPYPKWESFRELLRRVLSDYWSLAEPSKFARIGLRYINKIDIPLKEKARLNLSDYCAFYPEVPKELPPFGPNMNLHLEIPEANGRDQLLLTLAVVKPENPEVVTCLLDLDDVLRQPGAVPVDDTVDWLDGGHATISEAFEACIRDPLRELFQEQVHD